MPFERKRPDLVLSEEMIEELTKISLSRTEAVRRVERAKILLAYARGDSISGIAHQLGTNRPKIERCVDKALQLGPLAALEDLPGRGKPPSITSEARAWVVSLACQKPKDFGYSYELWTTKLLAKHIRKTCREYDHSCLAEISRGTVSKILSKSEIRPHKITYYLERRDPEFDQKMAQVLYVYKEVQMIQEKGKDVSSSLVIVSYDEKPGIQAIENTAPDLPPVPGKYPTIARDHEYIRHGTLSLLAGIDLLNGQVHGIVEERHRSREFVKFLQVLDENYPKTAKIKIVLDNHSSHISKETRTYLNSVPNRFEFIYTPKHGSWLNLVESFFAKLAKTMLRGIRVKSRQELKERIQKFLNEINDEPVIFKWKYNLDSIKLT